MHISRNIDPVPKNLVDISNYRLAQSSAQVQQAQYPGCLRSHQCSLNMSNLSNPTQNKFGFDIISGQWFVYSRTFGTYEVNDYRLISFKLKRKEQVRFKINDISDVFTDLKMNCHMSTTNTFELLGKSAISIYILDLHGKFLFLLTYVLHK